MEPMTLADRIFAEADQTWFAAVSGDCNPMHMDALAACRTMAGYPVVHGIHMLVWALDSLFKAQPGLPPPNAIKAGFEKMVYVGDSVRAVLTSHDPARVRLEVQVEDVVALSCDLTFGDPIAEARTIPDGPLLSPLEPLDLTFEEMEDASGCVPPPPGLARIVAAFPSLTGVLGAERVGTLVSTSYLVGMVCPGLHSIYRGLNLTLTPEGAGDGLRFRVRHADEDYRFLRLGVAGGGLAGDIDCNARPAPAAQADMAKIAEHVVAGEFAGVHALVVGGSRGLGEVVAKALAVGGARVTLTYAVGIADAARVRDEIVAFGGQCDTLRYDVREGAEQLSALQSAPTAVYYMATPAIFRRAGAAYSDAKFQDFFRFYVIGFSALCQALATRGGKDIAVFYPSSTAVEDRPANMTEYAMAKAAGELLCADMAKFEKWRRIVVRRLPRLPTDQTATLFEDDSEDPLLAMLPIVRDMHR